MKVTTQYFIDDTIIKTLFSTYVYEIICVASPGTMLKQHQQQCESYLSVLAFTFN